MKRIYIVMEEEFENSQLICSYAKAFSNEVKARQHIKEDYEITLSEWGCEEGNIHPTEHGNKTTISYDDKLLYYTLIPSDIE